MPMPRPGVVNIVRPVRVVIALGGNAMTAPDGRARPEDQRAAVTAAMESVADLVVAGAEVVVTHGNGPQVGNLLVKNEDRGLRHAAGAARLVRLRRALAPPDQGRSVASPQP